MPQYRIAPSILLANFARLGDEVSAVVAAARTIAVVAGAIGLALVRRALGRPELAWVACLALGFGGLKFLVDDLPNGRASTLFVVFPVYGLSLILVPRLIRGQAKR